jgi:hypothetical protein
LAAPANAIINCPQVQPGLAQQSMVVVNHVASSIVSSYRYTNVIPSGQHRSCCTVVGCRLPNATARCEVDVVVKDIIIRSHHRVVSFFRDAARSIEEYSQQYCSLCKRYTGFVPETISQHKQTLLSLSAYAVISGPGLEWCVAANGRGRESYNFGGSIHLLVRYYCMQTKEGVKP